MLLEKLINPKPKTTLYFVVLSLFFLSIPLIKNSTHNFYNINQFSIILFFISALCIVLHAFGLNNLIYKNDVIKKENIIIATVFVLLNTFNLEATIDLLSSFLMLFFINYLLASYQKEYPFNEIFFSSLFLSIIVILNPIYILMYVLLIICSLVFNYSNWRCYIVSLIGICMPIIFYLMINNILDQKINLSNLYIIPELNFDLAHLKNVIYTSKNIFIAFFIIFLISILEFFNWLYKKSMRSRKSFFVILGYLILAIVIALFGTKYNWYILLSPLSIFIANYFTYTKKRNLANILFYVFIFTSFYYRWNIII